MQTHSRTHTHVGAQTPARSRSYTYCTVEEIHIATIFPQLSDPNLSDTIIRFSGGIAQHERVNGEEGDVDEQLHTGRPLLQLYSPHNMLLYAVMH